MSAAERETFRAEFQNSVAEHQIEVIRNDGLYRHIRFQRPGRWCMGFDLITWPGHLCYTGDMGTYVFSRLRDMFEFFRGSGVNPSYWAEKVLASDKYDGIKEWSEEKFREAVTEYFNCATEDWEPEKRSELWGEVNDQILLVIDDGKERAEMAVYDFEHDGFRFQDFWEHDTTEWTHRFLWCCHALQWGIALYDSTMEAVA
jgi:hypothetical protein